MSHVHKQQCVCCYDKPYLSTSLIVDQVGVALSSLFDLCRATGHLDFPAGWKPNGKRSTVPSVEPPPPSPRESAVLNVMACAVWVSCISCWHYLSTSPSPGAVCSGATCHNGNYFQSRKSVPFSLFY